MQIIFALVVALGLAYFLIARRRFDLFSLGFLSSCVYFMPGFFGYALHPVRDNAPFMPIPLDERVYGVMALVLIGVLVGGVLFSRAIGNRTLRGLNIPVSPDHLLLTLIGLAYFGMSMSILSSRQNLLNPDKLVVLAHLSRWHTFSMTAATIAAVLAAVRRKKIALLLLALLFGFDLYIGFRVNAALAAIAALMGVLSQRPPSRFLVARGKLALLGVLIALFFFVAPVLYIVFRADQTRARLFLSPDIYLEQITNSEPFITQAILNKVILTGYTVPGSHLLSPLAILIPFYTELYEAPKSFSDYFQPDLFPDYRKYGVANNFWAEGIAVGGWGLLLVYVWVYVIGLWIGSLLLRSKNAPIVGIAAVVFSYWAFYIHRNDLLYQLNLERNLIVFFVIAVWLTRLIGKVGPGRRLRPATRPSQIGSAAA